MLTLLFIRIAREAKTPAVSLLHLPSSLLSTPLQQMTLQGGLLINSVQKPRLRILLVSPFNSATYLMRLWDWFFRNLLINSLSPVIFRYGSSSDLTSNFVPRKRTGSSPRVFRTVSGSSSQSNHIAEPRKRRTKRNYMDDLLADDKVTSTGED